MENRIKVEGRCTIHVPHKSVANLVVVYIKLEANGHELLWTVGIFGIEFAWSAKRYNQSLNRFQSHEYAQFQPFALRPLAAATLTVPPPIRIPHLKLLPSV
jgi:hypothetical protein